MAEIIIIADRNDRDLNRVEGILRTRGIRLSRLRLGVSEGQIDITSDLSEFQIVQNGDAITSSSFGVAKVAIYRRWAMIPIAPVVSSLESPSEREFAEREWDSCLFNALLMAEYSSPDLVWANAPSLTDAVGYKQWLLGVARLEGFRVPDTFSGTVLNSVNLTKGEWVAKAISANEHFADGRHFPTTTLTHSQLDELNRLRPPVPSLVQERINATCELRILVAFDKLVALKLSGNDSGSDLRLLPRSDIEVAPVDCPIEIGEKLVGLSRRLRLGMCVYDVLIDEDGTGFLVDITPNGSWFFYEDGLSDPVVSNLVADAVTEAL